MAAVVTGRSRPGGGELPAELTSFVGRRREITAARRMLSHTRCLTLTGVGGVGKTRLALRLAAGVRRAFKAGTWFVELAELREGALLAEVVKERLGLLDQSSRTALDLITDYLGDKDGLLVLDNCEHLIDESAALVDALLRSCPRLRVLATSRQSLGVPGEKVYGVPPLPVPPLPAVGESTPPSPEALMQYPSIQLFTERAQSVLSDFELTERDSAVLVRLCHELDGVPLALELAAVSLRMLSLPQIEERLVGGRPLPPSRRQVPERHQALNQLVDWSYALCTEQEQALWARASVFSGTFDLDAAEYVTSDAEVPAADVLGLIDSLVDKSILVREEHPGAVRYRLLEILREYGQTKVVAAGMRATFARRHRDWYARLTARFADDWIGPDQVAWIARLRREHSNLRAALEFCATEAGEVNAGLRMTVRIEDYWATRGLHTEARYWLDQLLATAPEVSADRLSALRLNCWFALLQGDAETSRVLWEKATELAEEIGDAAEDAYLTQVPGMAALYSADLDKAHALLSDALARFQAAGVLRGELFCQFMLGLTVGLGGERRRGLALLQDCVEKTSRLGDEYWRSWALWATAHIEVLNDSLDVAKEASRSALRMQQPQENRLGTVFVLDTLGWIAGRHRQHTRAATLFGAGDAMFRAIGTAPENYLPFAEQHHEHVARTREALGAEAYEQAYRYGYALPPDSAIEYALETTTLADASGSAAPPDATLTSREREIADLVAQGHTDKEIARRLFISQRTAEGHVQHILVKLAFTSRAQIATWVTEANVASRADHPVP